MAGITAMVVASAVSTIVTFAAQLAENVLPVTILDFLQQFVYVVSIFAARYLFHHTIDAFLDAHLVNGAGHYVRGIVPRWWLFILISFTVSDAFTDIESLVKCLDIAPAATFSSPRIAWLAGAIFALAVDATMLVLLAILWILSSACVWDLGAPAF
jgi:hypothetical protein